MNWFNRTPPPQPDIKLPKNDAPEAAPRPLPRMSVEREQAIEKLIATGYERDGVHRPVRDARHALFLAAAGVLKLPA